MFFKDTAKRSKQSGFTLIEILLFVGIFSLVVVAFMSIFVSVSQVTLRQTSASEVAAQSQLLLQTIQYYVERSSVVEMTQDVASTSLRLRMASSTEDPLSIYAQSNRVVLSYGAQSQNLTSTKVKVTNLTFTRRANPLGHDSVAVSFTLEYNSDNVKQKFVQAFSTSIARVSAASFDSNVVPGTSNTYTLGATTGDWKSINSTIYFSGAKVGIGIAAPSSTFEVSGGDVYVDTVPYGLVLKAPVGNVCYRLTVTNSGALATSTVGC